MITTPLDSSNPFNTACSVTITGTVNKGHALTASNNFTDDDVFLTTDETMKILGLSRQSISRLRSTGELTTYKKGSKYLSSEQEVRELLIKRTTVQKVYRKYFCPNCKMETGVEIVYGYPIDPSPEKHGEIVFGGCLVFGDDQPDRQCLNCKHRWKHQNHNK